MGFPYNMCTFSVVRGRSIKHKMTDGTIVVCQPHVHICPLSWEVLHDDMGATFTPACRLVLLYYDRDRVSFRYLFTSYFHPYQKHACLNYSHCESAYKASFKVKSAEINLLVLLTPLVFLSSTKAVNSRASTPLEYAKANCHYNTS